MKNKLFGLSSIAIALSLIFPAKSQAQIVGDRTLPVNTVVNVQGKTFTITGGTQVGGNQFHSFQQFSVPNQSTAYFNNNTDVSNIISRVTGNTVSSIDGLIKANGQANLYLINPNGIIFGKDAQLQIGGSFTASTASSIKFPDGQEYSATNPQTSVLSVNVPLGLQYGKDHQASITNEGSLISNKNLTLSAASVANRGYLEAAQGNLLVESINGDVEINETFSKTATFNSSHNLVLNNSQIGTLGDLNLFAKDSVIARDSSDRPFIAAAGGKLTVQGDRLVDIFTLNNSDSGFYSGSDMVFRSANSVIGDAHYYANGSFRVEKLDGTLGTLESPVDPLIVSTGDVNLGIYLGRSLHIIAGGEVTIDAIQITGADTTNNSISPDNPATSALANVTLANGKTITINGNAQATLDIRAGVDIANLGLTAGVTSPPTSLIISGGDSSVITNIATQIRTGLATQSITFNRARTACLAGNASCFINSSLTALAAIPNTNPPISQESGIKIGNLLINRPDALVLLTNNYSPNQNLPSPNRGGLIEITGISAVNPITSIFSGLSGVAIAPANALLGNGGKLFIDSRSSIKLGDNTSIVTNSNGANNNAGEITLLAKDQLNIGKNVQLLSIGNNLSGQINLSSQGSINIDNNVSLLNSSNQLQGRNGGSINLFAANQINFGDNVQIRANAQNLGGQIQIVSNGAIAGLSTPAVKGLLISSNSLSSNSVGDSGNIKIAATGLSLTNSDVFSSQISTTTAGGANAGNILLEISGDLSLDGFLGNASTEIRSQVLSATAQGNSGNVSIQKVNQLLLKNTAKITTNTEGIGNAGAVTIAAKLVNIDGLRTGINSQVLNNSTGSGNLIDIQTNSLALTNGSQINSELSGIGSPNSRSGDINIVANSRVELNSSSIIAKILGGSQGNGGKISLTSTKLDLLNGSQILGDTNGLGNAGDIKILLSSSGILDSSLISSSVSANGVGNGGNVEVSASELLINKGTQISSGVNGKGNGGNVTVKVDTLKIDGVGSFDGVPTISGLFGSVNQGAVGNGGKVVVLGKTNESADRIEISNGGRISASTSGNGNAGLISVTANSLDISSGGKLRTVTNSTGNAGDINLFLRDRLLITGDGSGIFAESSATSTGLGGKIFIDPIIVSLINGAKVSVSSLGQGDGGNIMLIAASLNLDNSSIVAETANGKGGNITLKIADSLWLRNSSLISATAGNNGDGGNIDLGAKFVLAFSTENSDIFANAFKGRGGNISITTQGLFGLEFRDRPTTLSDITASSEFGLNGTVLINTPGVDPSKGLGTLPIDLIDASSLLSQRCSADSVNSKFFITGRGGLPPSPSDSIYNSYQILPNLGAVRELSTNQQSVSQSAISRPISVQTTTASVQSERIIEAQGWVIDDKGKIALVANAPQPVHNSIWSSQPTCVSTSAR